MIGSMDQTKLALRQLVLTEPFFASMLLGLELEESECRAAINRKVLKANPAFMESLSPRERRTVLAHEALHLALLHDLRWKDVAARYHDADFSMWNRACDYALNQQLQGLKWSLPEDALLDARFAGQGAEEIFHTLHSEQSAMEEPPPPPPQEPPPAPTGEGDEGETPPPEGTQDAEGDPQDAPNPAQGSEDATPSASDMETDAEPVGWGQVEEPPETSNEEAAEIKRQVQQAITVAKAQGHLPAGIEREFKSALEPVVNWTDWLGNWLEDKVPSDWTWMQPHPHYMTQGIIMPTLGSPEYGDIILAVDDSASMSEQELERAAGELCGAMAAYEANGQSVEVPVLVCDSRVHTHYSIQDAGDLRPLAGGGGTLFEPVFEKVAQEGLECRALVYVTDGGASDFPAQAPDYDVLWLITEQGDKRFDPPFGVVLHM